MILHEIINNFFFRKKNNKNSNYKTIKIFGLRRSGNHAIINWILANLAKTKKHQILIPSGDYGFKLQCFGDIFHLNDISSWQYGLEYKNVLNIAIKKEARVILFSYEDDCSYIDNEQNLFTIIRDLPSIISSRIKKIENSKKIYRKLLKIDDDFFENWILLASHPNVIIYEKWLTSKEYRDQMSIKFNVKNDIDFIDYVPRNAGGSSFTGYNLDSIENLINRHSMVKMPHYVQKWLNDDRIKKIRNSLGYPYQFKS